MFLTCLLYRFLEKFINIWTYVSLYISSINVCINCIYFSKIIVREYGSDHARNKKNYLTIRTGFLHFLKKIFIRSYLRLPVFSRLFVADAHMIFSKKKSVLPHLQNFWHTNTKIVSIFFAVINRSLKISVKFRSVFIFCRFSMYFGVRLFHLLFYAVEECRVQMFSIVVFVVNF